VSNQRPNRSVVRARSAAIRFVADIACELGDDAQVAPLLFVSEQAARCGECRSVLARCGLEDLPSVAAREDTTWDSAHHDRR
jgi:hypothetical protein